MYNPNVKSKSTVAAILSVLQLLAVIPVMLFYVAAMVLDSVFGLFGHGVYNRMMIAIAGVYVCAVMVAYGVGRLILINKAGKIAQMARAHGGRIPVETAALHLGVPQKNLCKDIGRMFASRYITGASIDAERKEIVFDRAEAPKDEPAEDATIFTEARNMKFTPAAVFVGIWLNAYAFWGLPNILGLIAIAAVSVAATVVTFLLTPGSKRLVESKRPSKKAQRSHSGDMSFDDRMNGALERLSELEDLSKSLSASNIGGQLRAITDITREILDHLDSNHDKMKNLRQFLGYYLPTSVNLFKEYAQLTNRAVKTDNILSSIKSIEEFTERIRTIFKNELNNLYMNSAVDITAEIAVMRSMMQGSPGIDADAGGESTGNP
jgi:5-bromo-4-chloroindolyl phosphate hydrolysis protein